MRVVPRPPSRRRMGGWDGGIGCLRVSEKKGDGFGGRGLLGLSGEVDSRAGERLGAV